MYLSGSYHEQIESRIAAAEANLPNGSIETRLDAIEVKFSDPAPYAGAPLTTGIPTGLSGLLLSDVVSQMNSTNGTLNSACGRINNIESILKNKGFMANA